MSDQPIGQLHHAGRAGETITPSTLGQDGDWTMTAGADMRSGMAVRINPEDGKLWPWFAAAGIVPSPPSGTR